MPSKELRVTKMKLVWSILLGIAAVSLLVAADVITEPYCYWSGTAPVCQGSCETGEFVAATNKQGDGKTCVSGVKRYCCKMPPIWLAQLPPFLGRSAGDPTAIALESSPSIPPIPSPPY